MNSNKIVKETFNYLVLRNLLIPINVLGTILIIRFLHPAEYGKWIFIWNVVFTGAPLFSLGWLETLSKFLPEKTTIDEKNNLFTIAFLTTCFFCLIGIIPYYWIFKFFSRIIPLEIRLVAYSLYIFLCFSAFLNLFDGYYRGEGRFNFWTILGGFRALFSILLSLLFIYFVSRRYESVYYSYLGITTMILMAFILIYRKAFRIQKLVLSPDIFSFLIFAYLAQIAFILRTDVDPFLIRFITRKSFVLAYFDVGIKIPRLLESLLITPLSVPLLYYFSHPNPNINKEKFVIFGSKILAFLFATFSVILYSFAGWIIPTLFSTNYFESIFVLKVTAFIPFFTSILILGNTHLFASNKPKVPVLLMLLGFSISCILDCLWIPQYGINGAAISGLLVSIILGIINLFYLTRHQIHLEKIFYKLILVLGVSIALNSWISYSALPFFLAFSWLGKIVTLEDIQKVTQFFRELLIGRLDTIAS